MIKCLLTLLLLITLTARAEFKAGAFAQDISPTKFPAPVNGGMKGNFANSIHDPMHARCLALHDGKRALVYVVVDACLIPREICEEAKELAAKETQIPKEHILISATHTHSAAALTPAFQSDPDPEYVKGVPALIAKGIIQAVKNLEPAEFGWAFGSDPAQVFNRRWYVKEGQYYDNPFGVTTDRARMNPGNVNPTVSIPTGPVDQDVAVMAVRSAADQRPIGLLANYSLHYVGGNPAISADYFGAFAKEIGLRLKADDGRYQGKPAFVGIMSNGTSGQINNVNFGSTLRHKRNPGEQIQIVARSVADAAEGAYAVIKWQKEVTIDSEEADIELGVRKGNAQEMAQAKEWLATIPKDKDGQWADRKAIYARETVKLAEYPDTVPVKLQAHRINNLSVASIPCEVFVEIGLQLKRTSPFERHFTISLANGYNGYLPTPEHHALGGYETWRARSSYLEVPASVKITAKLEDMLSALKRRAP
ncbi:MAG TPA: neutral/alkaline non-lysosomal ceramidase N-terminal domain-containing protein [Prosthecobacter sp.]|nr:neutral/alkaline non-lysosomal ceramidase N-terminal domain-containing protein [Prosthecobacter sp.]